VCHEFLGLAELWLRPWPQAAFRQPSHKEANLPENTEKISSPEDLAAAFNRYSLLTSDGIHVELAIDFSGSAEEARARCTQAPCARYTQAPRARCRPFIGQVHGTVAGRKEIKAALEAFKRMFSFVNCRTVTLKAWALNTETGPYSETLVADADWDIGVRFLGTLPPRMGSSSQPLAAMRGGLRSPLHPPCRCAELF
jgi:hypothetical protein